MSDTVVRPGGGQMKVICSVDSDGDIVLDSDGNPVGSVAIAGPTTIEEVTGQHVQVTTTTGTLASAISASYIDVIAADNPCFISIGPDATVEAVLNTSYYLPAATIVRFAITSGYNVAAITASGTAELYVHAVT